MPTASSPSTITNRLLDGIHRGEWDALSALYADDAVVEIPFAQPTMIRLAGREAIAAHFAMAARSPLRLRVTKRMIHETLDPELVVAEYEYEGTLTTTDRSLCVANVQLVRVRDGRIVASRDFHDHAAIGAALRQP